MAALLTKTTDVTVATDLTVATDVTVGSASPVANDELTGTDPHPIDAPAQDVAEDGETEGTDAQYGRVAWRGLIGGWALGSVLFVALARLGLPHVGWAWWLGIGLSTAFWVGPFFGLLFANAAFQLDLEEARRARRQATVDAVTRSTGG